MCKHSMEIDEFCRVETYGHPCTSQDFQVVQNKTAKSDDIIKSFFDNPQKFAQNSPQQSFQTPPKKFAKLSQKERKKLLKEKEEPNLVEEVVPKWTGWASTASVNGNGSHNPSAHGG